MSEIDALLTENRKFPPSDAFRRAARVSDTSLYKVAEKNSEAFWESQANELEWFEKWTTVCEWKPPHAKWFTGGKINVPLKRNSDKAIEECPSIENVIVVQRRPGAGGDEAFAEMKEGRDHWWH